MLVAIQCSVSGCNKTAYKAGLCNPHYIKKRRYGSPLISRQRSKGAVSEIIMKEAHALVQLTRDKWAIIDLDDVERVGQFSWCYISTGYAYSHQAKLLLHQLIIGKAPDGYETDHENRDKLDCRKSNLSHVTYYHNRINSDINDSSQHCTYDVVRRKWKAIFKFHGKTIYSGYFERMEDAKAASRAARLRLEGDGMC